MKGKGRGVGVMNNEGTASVLRLRESKMEASQRIYSGFIIGIDRKEKEKLVGERMYVLVFKLV